METLSATSPEALAALQALVADQTVKPEEKRATLIAEIEKRDAIINILRAQLDLLRHRDHGPSSEKIQRKLEQYELMLEEIEAATAEAERVNDFETSCFVV